MPGVRYVRAAADGGSLKGGAPRVVWHALDANPHTVSARSAAQRLDKHGQASHLVWNPLNGEIIQLIPIVRAARSLVGSSGGSAAWSQQAAAGEVTAEGRLCVQICVVAFADDPFTARPMAGLREIMTWLDSWDVPRRWPAGAPASFPDCLALPRSRRLWARGGHFGACQVPGLTAAGPGAIDVERVTGWSAAHARGEALPVGASVRRQRPGSPRPGIGYDPADLGAFLGNRVAGAASLSRVR
ncbi:MAG TPA: hypothetical protein VIJ82_20040 [Streptosporangiaceae bacterium]|jgi:hypothetical protein